VTQINGTSGADNLNGTPGQDEIFGLGGDDVIDGGGAADTVMAGDGDDILTTGYADAGVDSLHGEAGNDRFNLGRTAVASGGGGVDTFALSKLAHASRILDFQAGAGGDKLDLRQFALDNSAWDGTGNPYSLGYLTLTRHRLGLTIGIDPEGDGAQILPALYLDGVDPLALTAANFDGPAALAAVPGTAAAETLSGGASLDTLTPGAGDDLVLGGGSVDTAVFAGRMSGYSFAFDEGGWIVDDIDPSNGDEGIDRLEGVETARFADGEIGLDVSPLIKSFAPALGESRGFQGTVAASDAGAVIVSWVTSSKVVFQLHDSAGNALTAPLDAFQGTSTGSIGAAFFADGGFVIVGQRIGGGQRPVARLFNADGTPRSDEFDLAPGAVANPYNFQVVVLADGSFVASWTRGQQSDADQGAVHLRHFGGDGAPLGAAWELDESAGAQRLGLVALAEGGLFLAWKTAEGAVVGQRHGEDGTSAGPLLTFQPAPDSAYGGVAVDQLADGRVIVAYAAAGGGIRGRIADPAEAEAGPEILLSSLGRGPIFPDVAALDDGGFIAVWEANFAERYAMGQRFNAAGERVGDEMSIWAGDAQAAPSVAALPGAGFVTAWQNSSFDGPLLGIGAAVHGGPTVAGGAGDDRISLADGLAAAGRSGNDIIQGSAEADLIRGDSGNDTLRGRGGADRIDGGSGNDLLDGGAGADILTGGLGHDVYVVDHVGDKAVEGGSSGNDTIESSVDYGLPTHFERLVLTGTAGRSGRGNSGDNSVTGNSGGNLLNGGSGNDNVDGGAGNDSLYGSLGMDVLKGGAGLDRFLFNTALGPTNVDRIVDFSPADDAFHLARYVFTKAGANGTLSPAAFHQGAAAADSSDRIVHDQATGRIFYDPDGSGAAAQVLFATVAAGTALTSADFILYS